VSVTGTVRFAWRGGFADAEVEALHAEGFGHAPTGDGWWERVNRHSLGWVCARPRGDGTLLGFVNVAWDGAGHAFVLDTVVAASARRLGVGTGLVAAAVDGAAAAGCEWLHVDFEDHLSGFYLDSCGFTPTGAGLVNLGRGVAHGGHGPAQWVT
jgi:GNAT superfamily N-acetyltransferase